MANIILLLLCLSIGLLLQRNKSLPKDAHISINTVILFVPLPAIALLNIPLLKLDMSLLSLVLLPWITFALSYFIMPLLGKRLGWNRETIGCLILTAGLGNTSFVGFPLLEAFFGKESIKYGVVLDQAGTFLIVSLFGIFVATRYSSGKMKMRLLVKKIFFFPPFLGFLIAVLLGVLGWRAEGMTKDILSQLAVTLTPLALISVGLQLRVRGIGEEIAPLMWGLGFKLLIVPLLFFGLYKCLNIPEDIFNVSVIEAAMAPMITASIVASSYSLNAKLAGLMVGVGVPISLLTVIFWYVLL